MPEHREGKFQSKLLKAIREKFPTSVVFKHSDSFLAGVPDVSVTHGGKTFWLELKVNLPIKKNGLQHLTLTRLHKASGNAFYVIYTEADKWIAVVPPDQLEMYEKTGTGHIASGRGMEVVLNILEKKDDHD